MALGAVQTPDRDAGEDGEDLHAKPARAWRCGRSRTEAGLDSHCPTHARPVAWSELMPLPTPAHTEERQKHPETFRATEPTAQN